MPFVLTALAFAVLVSVLRGGRFRRIPARPLAHAWLLFVGVAMQAGVDVAAGRGLIPEAGLFGWVLLATSQVLILLFVVLNWRLPGIPLLTIGFALNALVMAANGAMPVSADAIAALGIGPAEVPPGKHTLLTPDTRLGWLADIWPLPVLRSIISVGDAVIAAGIVPLTHSLMTGRGVEGAGTGGRFRSRSRPGPHGRPRA